MQLLLFADLPYLFRSRHSWTHVQITTANLAALEICNPWNATSLSPLFLLFLQLGRPLFVPLPIDVRHLLLLGDLLAPQDDQEAAEEGPRHNVGGQVHAEITLGSYNVRLTVIEIDCIIDLPGTRFASSSS